MSPMAPIHYGFDIGGTKIEIAGFDARFQLLDRWREPTPADDFDAFFQTIQTMVAAADQHFDARGTIGIGFPGIIKPDGRLLSANLPGLTGRNIAHALDQTLDRPFAIDNDCRCFTRSEIAPGGAAEQACHVFGAILGTGAGAGIAIDGEIYYGEQYLAGEWGHLPLSAALQQRHALSIHDCGCGQRGCVEQYIAGPGLARLYSTFCPQPQTTHGWLAQLRAGEPNAQRTHAIYMDVLGCAFANVIKLLAPDTIVIGGGLSNIAEIVDAIPDAVARHHFPDTHLPVFKTARFGDSSGVRGAALLGAHCSASPTPKDLPA